jgi:hypothetical protein
MDINSKLVLERSYFGFAEDGIMNETQYPMGYSQKFSADSDSMVDLQFFYLNLKVAKYGTIRIILESSRIWIFGYKSGCF